MPSGPGVETVSLLFGEQHCRSPDPSHAPCDNLKQDLARGLGCALACTCIIVPHAPSPAHRIACRSTLTCKLTYDHSCACSLCSMCAALPSVLCTATHLCDLIMCIQYTSTFVLPPPSTCGLAHPCVFYMLNVCVSLPIFLPRDRAEAERRAAAERAAAIKAQLEELSDEARVASAAARDAAKEAK